MVVRAVPGGSVGFSMIELIVVILILGILAIVAIPRLIGVESFNTKGFSDRVAAGLRFAQKQAVAKRRNVCVGVTASTVTFNYASAAGAGAACDTPLAGPGGEPAYVVAVEPRGVGTVTLSPATTFSFSALGRPSAGQSFTVTGSGIVTITVETETGHVRSS